MDQAVFGWSIQEFYRRYRNQELIVNRNYQRKLVWSAYEKSLLIDSIVKQYPIPLILLAEKEVDGKRCYEILDGMQRLNAIFGFIENEFSCNDCYFDVEQFTRAKQYAQEGIFSYDTNTIKLSADDCANFLDYNLPVTVYSSTKEDNIFEIFGRINSGGKHLSSQEQRQAGVISPFTSLIRKLAAEIRGDVSYDSLSLTKMPEISIENRLCSNRTGIIAEDVFWVKYGIINIQGLKNSEDEEYLVDIAISILKKEPFARSKESLDEAYQKDSTLSNEIQYALKQYGENELISDIKNIISVFVSMLDEICPKDETNRYLINLFNQGKGSSIKHDFYAIFMALYELLVKEQKSPSDIVNIFKSMSGLHSKIKVDTHYVKSEDRVNNIGIVKGLIQKFFVQKEPSVLTHGPGLIIDFENSIRRSKIETNHYEFKQGILRLDSVRKEDVELEEKILETICGIANIKRNTKGYLYIGIADKKADADRIKLLDSICPISLADTFIVGIDREANVLGLKTEDYCKKILSLIKESKLSDNLKNQIINDFDVISYHGLSVIRIVITAQKDVSYLNDKVFIREFSSTKELTSAAKIIELQKFYAQE